jgi:hypothetical protein
MDAMFLVALPLLALLGIGLTTAGTVKAILNRKRRRRMSESDVIPSEWTDKCFVLEANRILGVLRNVEGAKGIMAAVAVPEQRAIQALVRVFRGRKEAAIAVPRALESCLLPPFMAPASDYKLRSRDWSLYAVNKSRESLLAGLPSGWERLVIGESGGARE